VPSADEAREEKAFSEKMKKTKARWRRAPAKMAEYLPVDDGDGGGAGHHRISGAQPCYLS